MKIAELVILSLQPERIYHGFSLGRIIGSLWTGYIYSIDALRTAERELGKGYLTAYRPRPQILPLAET